MSLKRANAAPLAISCLATGFAILLLFVSRGSNSILPTPLAGLVRQVEWITYDARMRLASTLVDRAQISTNLATIFYDDGAIKKLNDGTYGYRVRWPWPRMIHGQVVRELLAQGAKGVAFDIFFSEEDPCVTSEEIDAGIGGLTSDQFFATQVARAGNVTLSTEGQLLPAPMFRNGAAAVGSVASASDFSVLRRVSPYSEALEWHPRLLELEKPLGLRLDQVVEGNGSLIIPTTPLPGEKKSEPFVIYLNPNGSMCLDSDGQFVEPSDANGPADQYARMTRRYWSLGIIMAAQVLGLDLEHPVLKPESVTLNGTNGVSRTIPLDGEGRFLIDWSIRHEEMRTYRTPVYYGQVFEALIQDNSRRHGGTNQANPFKDKVVLIGSVATGNNISDIGSTPLEEKTPLVTKHINIANSIITGRFLDRAPAGAEVAIVVALGALSSLITWRRRVFTASSGVVLLALIYSVFTFWLFVEHRVWLSLLAPVSFGLILPHFSLITYRVVFEQKEQRRVKDIFTKIVSPDVVTELLGAETLALGGARRRITVYFADVRGFTEFTENAHNAAEEHIKKSNLSPEDAEAFVDQQAAETLATVNLYLGTISDRIKANRGTLDKYIGDCVMAFWGAPTPNERHALGCVRAAIESQRAIHELNQRRAAENERRKAENIQRAAEGKPPLPLQALLSLGTGINTGFAIVGLMGSDATILNYTVFGREVNLASRLEGISGRGRVIVSDSTLEDLKRDDPEMAATAIPLPPTLVKGFREPVKVYEVPWKTPAKPQPESEPQPKETP